MPKILIATTNPGKIKEIQALFQPLNYQVFGLDYLVPKLGPYPEVFETGSTLKANALLKAVSYGRWSKTLTLAEDTGLFVPSLNGLPGVKSKRFGHSDAHRNAKLIKLLAPPHASDRTAYFKTVIALYQPQIDQTHFFSGVLRGEIALEPLGTQGFGYDPIFLVKEKNLTLAQMSPSQKNSLSHRHQALQKLIHFLDASPKIS